MTVMPPRTARLAAAALAGALALAPLTACSFNSTTANCSVNSCTVTLSGDGSDTEILGYTLAYSGTQDGRASLTVGDTSVSCVQGESVAAGPLTLECTSVTDTSVELTASLG